MEVGIQCRGFGVGLLAGTRVGKGLAGGNPTPTSQNCSELLSLEFRCISNYVGLRAEPATSSTACVSKGSKLETFRSRPRRLHSEFRSGLINNGNQKALRWAWRKGSVSFLLDLTADSLSRSGPRILRGQDIWFNQRSRTQKQSNSLPVIVTAATQVPQNVDLPLVLPKKKKKPKASLKQTTKKKYPKRPLEPILREPANGLLVKHLVPIAYDVLEAKSILTKGVDLLLKASPMWACRFCTEVHVGLIGHTLRTCQGPRNDQRHSLHDWTKATINDVLVPVDSYHLEDRLAPPIAHDQRFDLERISAVEELCIQAGVDIPEYPTRRYSESIQSPVRKTEEDASWMGQQFVKQLETSTTGEDDVGGQVDALIGYQESENEGGEDHIVGGESFLESSNQSSSNGERVILAYLTNEDDLQTVAQETLQAWERMRAGAKKLKTKYRVVVCGYCPEVHVGPRGPRAQVCGAFKHQQRNGQHGWQNASIDDLIPPQYVWHVRDRDGPPFHQALKRFYGQAPAVVELCVQAGASIPDIHKPLMRLDIVIPRIEELEYVI